MNQKNFLTMAGLAAIVIILFMLLFSGGSAPVEDDMPTEGDETSMGVPAPGNEGVDETVVNDDNTDVMMFDLTGQNFSFSQDEIRVPLGTEVTINFESAMGTHDWRVDEFDAATEIVTDGDGMTSVTFVADTAGEFEYYCSVGMHRENGMVGTLIVE